MCVHLAPYRPSAALPAPSRISSGPPRQTFAFGAESSRSQRDATAANLTQGSGMCRQSAATAAPGLRWAALLLGATLAVGDGSDGFNAADRKLTRVFSESSATSGTRIEGCSRKHGPSHIASALNLPHVPSLAVGPCGSCAQRLRRILLARGGAGAAAGPWLRATHC